MIRRARADEAAALTGIAHSAKRHWGYPEAWIEAWREDLTVTAEYVRDQIVFAEVQTDAALGFYALEPNGRTAELAHLWVEPEHLGKNIGSRLFEHALEQAHAAGILELLIDSDPYAAGFYERMGAIQVGSVDAPMDGVERTRPQYQISFAS